MNKYFDLAQNINALGPPRGLSRATAKSSNLLLSYPMQQNQGVSADIAAFLGVHKGSVVFANGSTEVFFFLPKMLKMKKVLIVQPTFWEYEFFNEKNGIAIENFILKESEGFRLNFAQLEKKAKANVAIYLCNPNNPTSTVTEGKELLGLVKKSKKTLFVVDETYLIFRQDYNERTLVKHAQHLDNLLVVGSFSKIFALPGVRSGYLVASPANIKLFCDTRIPYASSSLSEALTQWLMLQTGYLKKTTTYYEKARESFYAEIDKKLAKKLKCFRPEANFILAKILTGKTSTQVVGSLKKHGFLIRNGAELSCLNDRWIRFAISKEKQNKMLIEALGKVL